MTDAATERQEHICTIAVAMINFNGARYIARAIESVLSQTRMPDELIIVDDGSSDDSISIIGSFAKANSFISVFKNDVNLGPAGNRDNAIKRASARFVINIDSDDWFEPTVIERTLASLCANPDAIAISSFTVCDGSELPMIVVDTSTFCMSSPRKQRFLLASRHRGMPGNQLAFAKATYIAIGGLDGRLRMYEDWDLQLRLVMRHVRWIHTGISGFCYRKTHSGLSSANQLRHMRYRLMVVWKIARYSRFDIIFLAGVVSLFALKGFKYITGSASPIGYN